MKSVYDEHLMQTLVNETNDAVIRHVGEFSHSLGPQSHMPVCTCGWYGQAWQNGRYTSPFSDSTNIQLDKLLHLTEEIARKTQA